MTEAQTALAPPVRIRRRDLLKVIAACGHRLAVVAFDEIGGAMHAGATTDHKFSASAD